MKIVGCTTALPRNAFPAGKWHSNVLIAATLMGFGISGAIGFSGSQPWNLNPILKTKDLGFLIRRPGPVSANSLRTLRCGTERALIARALHRSYPTTTMPSQYPREMRFLPLPIPPPILRCLPTWAERIP